MEPDPVAGRRVMVAALALTCGAAGCLQTGYVIQAGLGQLQMMGDTRPIDDVIEDSETDPRTRVLLAEVAPILRFARDNGLATKGNYRNYIELDRPGAVWFMATSKELEFKPKVWNFPIVGSFTYLGWFDYYEAQGVRHRLERDGWDVHVRPARAYSTGGWFTDPVVSTMLSSGDDAFRDLANVLLHELTHANVLVRDQSTFNESIAAFMGDTLAEQYLIDRFGAKSSEVAAYREELVESRGRGSALADAYQTLKELYDSDRSDADKRAEKKTILNRLEIELGLRYRPNNASLIGFKTYNAGYAEITSLFAACGRDWHRFIPFVKTLKSNDFAKKQEENIGSTIAKLEQRGCP